LLFLVACSVTTGDGSGGASSSSSGGNGGPGSGDPGADGGKPRKVCSRFAGTASSWAVPDASFNRVNATYGQWLTMDLDGDGKVDLVRAEDPKVDGKPFGAAAGKPYWQMFKGGEGGFAKAATEWSVPDVLFSRVNATYGQWLTMDLDHDGKVDLVRANDPDNDGKAYGAAAGKPHWQAFKGGEGGFGGVTRLGGAVDVVAEDFADEIDELAEALTAGVGFFSSRGDEFVELFGECGGVEVAGAPRRREAVAEGPRGGVGEIARAGEAAAAARS
jgi:hypothetical protein